MAIHVKNVLIQTLVPVVQNNFTLMLHQISVKSVLSVANPVQTHQIVSHAIKDYTSTVKEIAYLVLKESVHAQLQ